MVEDTVQAGGRLMRPSVFMGDILGMGVIRVIEDTGSRLRGGIGAPSGE